jgi:hypothetical protein
MLFERDQVAGWSSARVAAIEQIVNNINAYTLSIKPVKVKLKTGEINLCFIALLKGCVTVQSRTRLGPQNPNLCSCAWFPPIVGLMLFSHSNQREAGPVPGIGIALPRCRHSELQGQTLVAVFEVLPIETDH